MTRFLIAASILSVLAPLPAFAQCDCEAEDTLIVGHRGDGSGADENTIPSIQTAFDAGADMVEIDVQLSSDGVVVLMHDDTVNRTTDGTGCVSGLTAAELDALAVPTLAALLAAVDGALDVEIKLHDTDACPAEDLNALADGVAAELLADPVADRRVIVTSFDRPLLQRLHTTAPMLPIGLLGADPGLIEQAEEDGFVAAALFGVVINERVVRRARDANIQLYVWTINGAEELEAILAFGVEGVITDTVGDGVSARSRVCDTWVCEMDAGPRADAGAVDAGSGGASGGGCVVRPGLPLGGAPVVLFALSVSLWMRRRG